MGIQTLNSSVPNRNSLLTAQYDRLYVHGKHRQVSYTGHCSVSGSNLCSFRLITRLIVEQSLCRCNIVLLGREFATDGFISRAVDHM